MGKKSKKKHSNQGASLNAAVTTESMLQSKETNLEKIKSLFTDAETALDSFHYETAANCCQQILALDTENTDAMDMLGDIYAELGSIEEAKNLWLKCIELSPNVGYKKYFGLAQVSDGKKSLDFYEKGILILEQLVETESVQPGEDSSTSTLKLALSDSYCAVAELYMTDLCDEENAAEFCKTAIDKSISVMPENADAYRILSSFLINQDKSEEAQLAIQKNLDLWFTQYEAICNNPDNDVETEISLPEYSTRIEIGKILIELKMYEQASIIFEGLLEEDDEIFVVWYLFGILYHSQGEKYYHTAMPYLQKAKEIAHQTGEEDTDEALHINELLQSLNAENGVLKHQNDSNEDNLSEHFYSNRDNEHEMMDT